MNIKKESENHLHLIDGSGFIFRAYYALPPLTRSDGLPVGAVAGFCNMIYKLMKDNYIRPLKISKYCIGIIDMYGKNKVKYNRFKKKILKLNKLQANAS